MKYITKEELQLNSIINRKGKKIQISKKSIFRILSLKMINLIMYLTIITKINPKSYLKKNLSQCGS